MDQNDLYQYDLPRDDAALVSQSVHNFVKAGEPFQVRFELMNTGFSTWRSKDGYGLANTNNAPIGADSTLPMSRESSQKKPFVCQFQWLHPRIPVHTILNGGWYMTGPFGPTLSTDVIVSRGDVGGVPTDPDPLKRVAQFFTNLLNDVKGQVT